MRAADRPATMATTPSIVAIPCATAWLTSPASKYRRVRSADEPGTMTSRVGTVMMIFSSRNTPPNQAQHSPITTHPVNTATWFGIPESAIARRIVLPTMPITPATMAGRSGALSIKAHPKTATKPASARRLHKTVGAKTTGGGGSPVIPPALATTHTPIAIATKIIAA